MTNVFACFSRSAKSRRAGRILICSILTFGILMSSTACKKKIFKERSDIDLSSFDECPVELMVKVIRNRKVRVTLTNKGETSYSYGHEYRLEYRQSGKWYKVPFLPNVRFTQMGSTLGHGETFTLGDEEYVISNKAEMTYYLDEMHSDLPSGHYRIIKEISPKSSPNTHFWIAGEFDLETATSEAVPLQKSKIDPAQVIPTDEQTLRITSAYYIREENTLMIKYSKNIEFLLEMQQDGQWYEIPVKGYGTTFDSSRLDQEIEMYLNQELASGHYRLILDNYLLGNTKEDSPRRYHTYEFDI